MAFLRDSHTKWEVDMATHYKGQRIAELLEDIDRLSKALDESQGEFEDEIQFIRTIEAQTTLAIAKAKLTALQGENNAS